MTQNQSIIYMDHSATTPLAPEAFEAMLPYFSQEYGNPSSIHRLGRRSHSALDKARRTIADILGASSSEIFCMGCGSEADNAALRGIALARRSRTGANRIITSAVEHRAILNTACDLRDHFGFDLTLLPVDEFGRIDLSELEEALGDEVALVSVMVANNEIGTVTPIDEVGALCRAHEIPLHSDAVQAAGRLPLKVDDLQVDALSFSAHKFYGPKGVGFLYLRKGTPFQTYLTGGSHEGGRRAGTENVPGIVGMAAAFELAEQERPTEVVRLTQLRDRLIQGVLSQIDGARLTGHPTERLSNHASFVIDGVEAEGILIGLDLAGIAASSGSACMSASQKPSHVLDAIGVPGSALAGGLRLSLGRSTTDAHVDHLLSSLDRIVAQIRGTQPIVL